MSNIDKPALATFGFIMGNALIAAGIHDLCPDSAFSFVFAVFAAISLFLFPIVYYVFGGEV